MMPPVNDVPIITLLHHLTEQKIIDKRTAYEIYNNGIRPMGEDQAKKTEYIWKFQP